MSLYEACEDLRYLLNRGYKKTYALDFVCNHYQLLKKDRHFLARAIFSDAVVHAVHKKKVDIKDIEGENVAIDGFNVLITVEAVLKNQVILCDDSFVRDTQGIFGKYKISETTHEALQEIYGVLKKYPPHHVTFYLDQQVSHSGDLCSLIRPHFLCKTTNHVDAVLVELNLMTATADSVLIQKLNRCVDIPFEILLSKAL